MIRRLLGRTLETDPSLNTGDAAFMIDLQAAPLTQRTPGLMAVLYLIAAVLFGGLVWASLTRLAGIPQGEARIISRSGEMAMGDPTIAHQETLAYRSRLRALEKSVAALERRHALSKQAIVLGEPVASNALLSEVEVLRMSGQANHIKSQIVERHNKFRADANAELIRIERELSHLSKDLLEQELVMDRSTLEAPVYREVSKIQVNALDGAPQSRKHVLKVLPQKELLLVEGKINTHEIAFLRPELPAILKVAPYDFWHDEALMLDEPSHNMDTQAEAVFVDYLAGGNKDTIIAMLSGKSAPQDAGAAQATGSPNKQDAQ
ncbi:hypothetical protein [Pseudomonas sp. HY7a-MNA-CIBAN-0227]|uniref:hypothetical protein n=1 Tax=Pseudomonas sp. HY7a-MNA-CIBAN-0227 TaxID=3140474 RepID=UPI00332ACC5E